MSSSTPGSEVRSKVSVQPAQSWKCSQTTEGGRIAAISSATSPAHDFCVRASPTGATIMSSVQNLMKSLRETPACRSCSPIVSDAFSSAITAIRALPA
ncbi:MAG TPA: hypothetical protein VMT39_03470 [Candidatus Bathyarchaeia archaeon]|nr:hypothetical protein [Candidatus Bathyarchaeia archaeon]